MTRRPATIDLFDDDRPVAGPGRRSPQIGETGFRRLDRDLYETPTWCTAALLANWPLADGDGRRLAVWEPAAGNRAISSFLADRGWPCIESDLIGRPGVAGGVDFLAQGGLPVAEVDGRPVLARAIVTNPPYRDGLADAFCAHALAITRRVTGTVALFLRAEFDYASSRAPIFEDHPAFATKITLTRRPKWFGEDTKGPRYHFAWFVWDWSRPAGPPALRWG